MAAHRALAIVVLLATSAVAQEGHLGEGHDAWHEGFYIGLEKPSGGSCCSLTDCRPTQGRMIDDHYEVKVNGAWIAVPSNKIVKKSAPDGGYHVCAPYVFSGKPDDLYCVVLPPEG